MDTPWLEVLNPQVRTGHVRFALFDYDGTLSVVRRGWEGIMIPLMIESIGGGKPVPAAVQAEVAAYVDHSTGILTIKQMQWLAEAVRRYGWAEQPLTAMEYKKKYNERMLGPMRARLGTLDGSVEERDRLMIAGARGFLAALAERGVTLFLASGSDHQYVAEEAELLEISPYFAGGIYGARGASETDSKEAVIERILSENRLAGEELLVVGDGPVEIRCARRVGAVGLGVTTDEDTRCTMNPLKRARLVAAGADLLVTHFASGSELADLLCGRPAQ
jgi:phosphoglycolate phosphatase-like HAD superfamily hydrolase